MEHGGAFPLNGKLTLSGGEGRAVQAGRAGF